MPAYHHGSEVEALVRAGLRLRYYEATETLEPNAEELEVLLGPTVRALYLIHYLGFPQDAERWRAWCRERGLFLMEDAAQAFLASDKARPVGSSGDLAIFCLYKTFGLPDGAALLCANPPASPGSKRRAGTAMLVRRHVAWLAQRSPFITGLHSRAASVIERLEPALRPAPREEFELGDPYRAPSMATALILRKTIDPAAADHRRSNYRFLLKHLGALVPPPFALLPDGASPFTFPISVGARARSLARLHDRGIAGLDFWSKPHPSLPTAEFPRARRLRAQIVGLPVHQELTQADLMRIVEETLMACT
jgi:dTDP-4-amino-4,6-dideoxygalactose transaminase